MQSHSRVQHSSVRATRAPAAAPSRCVPVSSRLRPDAGPLPADRLLELQRLIGNQSVLGMLPSVQPAPAAAVARSTSVVQRVVRIAKRNVIPGRYQQVIAAVRQLIEANGLTWTSAHAVLLNGWLQDRNFALLADTLDHLAFNLYFHGDDSGSWQNMQLSAIAKADLDTGTQRRKRHRMSLVLKPSKVQTSKRAPGLGKLKNTELLRLNQPGQPEDEFWIRRPDSSVVTGKKRSLPEADESRIIAAGDKDDPSYVVWKQGKHLGHRYKGNSKKSHERTYGSKKLREGYEYKGSGLVDGHAIQIQDDQEILGPYQSDAPDWTTTVPTKSGTSTTYSDTPYLPTSSKDTAWIEKHPYNFYWENQEQGKHFRQKGIEAPALKNKSSFVHLNTFTGDTFQPNDGAKTDNIYPIASRVDYLVSDSTGDKHLKADNRPTADYSKPSNYDKTTNRYKDVPSGVASHDQNASLGGWKVADHLKLAQQADTTKFPYATVLEPHEPTFDFMPEFREELSGYDSPPPSPFHVPSALEDQSSVLPGDESHLMDFEHTGKLVEAATYDKVKKQTTLKLTGVRTVGDADLTSDGSVFKTLMGGVKGKPKATAAPTAGTGYMPTPQQETALATTYHRSMDWTVPDGFCIFATLGTMTGQSGQAVQAAVLHALDHPTLAVTAFFLHSPYKAAEVRRAVRGIYTAWNTPVADVILPLAAVVLAQGVTVLNPNGTTTPVNGGGGLLVVRVENPNAHYHATR